MLGRNGIGIDINYQAIMLTLDRLNFTTTNLYEELPPSEIRVYQGDARWMNLIPDESVDLVATHPPYAGIITYSKAHAVEGDLSQLRSLKAFYDAMEQVARECYRVSSMSIW